MFRGILLFVNMLLGVVLVNAQTPLSTNGRLKLVGNQLSNECGNAVQLRGMSTHGPQWYQQCYSSSAVKSMADDWGADVIRLAMYTQPVTNDGYLSNKSYWDQWIDRMVGFAETNGMYCIIDWHILKDNDPWDHMEEAKVFWQSMATKYGNNKSVLFEICNEPNGNVDWNRIKTYAEVIIPIIRAKAPESIVIVGTPQWSSDLQSAAASKLSGTNAYNVMYTFHFYAGSHFDYDKLKQAASRLPIFVTEWGTTDASGNGGYNASSSNTWLSILDGNNDGSQKISSCGWSFADKSETSAGLTAGACASGNFTSRTTSGTYMYNYMKTPDNFTACNTGGDDDGDGVSNANDLCPGTPAGIAVDVKGCEVVAQKDTDNDGVLDATDECPNTVAGTVVNYKGCPYVVDTMKVGNGFIDDFDSEDPVATPLGNSGVFWWSGEGKGTNAKPIYTIARSTTGMTVTLNEADAKYGAMGVSFGEGGKYIDLEEFSNADIHVNLTNKTSKEIFLSIQLEDAAGNKAEIIPEDQFLISWDNKWKKIGVGVKAGATKDLKISLGAVTDALAGYAAAGWDCGTALECPAVSYDIDPSKIVSLIMFVNGGGEIPSDPETTKTGVVSGDIVFNYFSIGDVENGKLVGEVDDTDLDGVVNEIDFCPATPSGVSVDAKGCALSQKDTDQDNVNDDVDACADTPFGVVVDATGCPLEGNGDEDADGVINDKDQCPFTAGGAIVDSKGCALSQLDSDNDEVSDAKDECGYTPEGETVDVKGCSDSQKDTDGDKVMDDKDLCPNTVAGTIVTTSGCAYLDEKLKVGNGFIDDFITVDPVSTTNGDAGVFWWAGEGKGANSKPIYTITRATNGMTVSLNEADLKYSAMGISFGENGEYIDLKEFGNADIHVNLTNKTSKDIFLSIQLEDANGGKAEIVPEDAFLITWTNKWEKIGAAVGAGKTVDVKIDLSSFEDDLGGYLAKAWGCDEAYNCPETEYTIDPSKITNIVMFVNGGGEIPSDPELTKTGVVSGDIVFNYFSIGDITNGVLVGESEGSVDTDEDGVVDIIDLCPNTTAGASVDAQGCKVTDHTDTDGDGVADVDDDCPGTKSGVVVDAFGCDKLLSSDVEITNEVNVYPNPASSNVVLTQETVEFTSVLFYTIAGELVSTIQVTSENEEIDLTGLATGVYTLKLIGSDKVKQLKLVIE